MPGSAMATSPGDAPVIVEEDGPLLRLRLNRPAKKNALDLAVLDGVLAGLDLARQRAGCRVVLLEAAGDHFCGGGDIQVMRAFADDGLAARDRLRHGLGAVVQAMHALPKPIVAMVQGNAYGAGAGLAFQADLAVAASHVQFSLSFRHVGLIPDTGLTWLLPRRLGMTRAKYLAWTAAPFSAADAVQWGLLHAAVAPEELASTTQRLASALADGPTATLGAIKQALHANAEADLQAALEREANLQAMQILGSEHREGRDAFFERRRPDWARADALRAQSMRME